jgi:nickel-dependent lactate racemase
VTYYARGSAREVITDAELRAALHEALSTLGPRRRVLALPPDFTRFHSRAGRITELVGEYYGGALTDVLPATGTHFPVSDQERRTMFGSLPASLFRVHRWKENLVTLGRVPADFLREVSGGAVDFDWPAEVNALVARGGHDLVLSIGQVVPHEVIGMAGYTKNLFIGTGGKEAIHKSHYLGAVYGMERMMGRWDTPVRAVLRYAAERFISDIPVVYVHTVVGRQPDGSLALKGLFIGDDHETFLRAAELAREVNVTLVEEPFPKVVVYLRPDEYRSTWLGNKAVYRTRMAVADGGEVVMLAPGVRQFGEDPGIDALIRKYGYFDTPRVLELVRQNADLAENLAVAAHLIHGASEGRFTVTCCPGGLSKAEVEKAAFRFADVDEMIRRYDPAVMKDGWNTMADGERVFYVSNPAIGLWASRARFRPATSAG